MNAIVFVWVLYYARKRFLFRHQFGGTKRRSVSCDGLPIGAAEELQHDLFDSAEGIRW
jgi:hypothetical protein